MALIKKTRGAQYPLVAEYVFNFNDQAAPCKISGVDVANYTDPKATQYDFGSGTASASLSLGAPVASGVAQTNVYELLSLPINAAILGGELFVETAYATVTTGTISLGDSTTATLYASAVDLKTAARTALTIPNEADLGVATPAGAYLGRDLRATITLTGIAATAGRVRVRVQYTIDGRMNEPQTT